MISHIFSDRKELSKAKTGRNEEIVRLHNDGMSFRALAKKYGISSARAAQIYYVYLSRLDKAK